jgi:crotonobetainyl-CoA:carnitine CoA-transferase CaiB-like acyl-CoA transferase
MAGALSNLLVVDLSRVLAGPYASMILGDFGADVIKVEQPGRGDDTRQWGPPFTPDGESAYYLCVNRNKRSITLDLKTPGGQDVLRDLVRRGDVLIENFRAGTMSKLGLGYEMLREINPSLVYCAITGYGQTGPYRDRPGYDAVIQAQGGIMSVTGAADGEPYKVGVAIADIAAGLYAAISITTALYFRQHTGVGQHIDVALFDAQLSWLANVASAYLISGDLPKRFGNAHATIVPYQTIQTADGWLVLAVGNDQQFASLCRIVDHPEWSIDERFATNPARVANRGILIPLLTEIFRTQQASCWINALLAVGVPCGPVNNVPAALNDPQTHARAMVQIIEDAAGRKIPLVGPVPKLSATPAQITATPPMLGEHTDQVLQGLLGYSDERIAALRAARAI